MTDTLFGLSEEFDAWAHKPVYLTYTFESIDLDRINLLKGMAVGQAMRIQDLEKQLEEAEEKVDLARRYQRALDVAKFRELKLKGTTNLLESLPLD